MQCDCCPGFVSMRFQAAPIQCLACWCLHWEEQVLKHKLKQALAPTWDEAHLPPQSGIFQARIYLCEHKFALFPISSEHSHVCTCTTQLTVFSFSGWLFSFLLFPVPVTTPTFPLFPQTSLHALLAAASLPCALASLYMSKLLGTSCLFCKVMWPWRR